MVSKVLDRVLRTHLLTSSFVTSGMTSSVTSGSPLAARPFDIPILGKTMSNFRQQVTFVKHEDQAREIFWSGVNSVIPSVLVRSNVVKVDDKLTICGSHHISLDQHPKTYVVGFGKAVLPMAEEMVNILQTQISRCVLSVPEGTRDSQFGVIEILRGARNNIPDEKAGDAAKEIVNLVSSCEESDLLIVLISGGGSALLPLPKFPILLQEKREIIKLLSRSGATINELNTVRKKLSVVKGGGLVQLCKSKNIVSLILSDVLGDPLDVIASGPTVLNTDGDQDALGVVRKILGNLNNVPASVVEVLQKEENEQRDFSRVNNFIIGNNKIALKHAAEHARRLNFHPIILTTHLEGEAKDLGEKLALLAHFVGESSANPEKILALIRELHLKDVEDNPGVLEEIMESIMRGTRDSRKICLLLGGEPTVKVVGQGVGGRNQELALAAASKLYALQSQNVITILSGGTDGIDGPCNMAGAVVNVDTITSAQAENISADDYLADNNSYNFFTQVAGGLYHLHCGHTGTNVCDIVVILIEPGVHHKSRL